MPPVLTIFTPTYNRAHTLPRLYQSLTEQESHDFVWLIVDDGSTDGTEGLVAQWKAEGKVVISYHRQENGGKMRAHNRGVELCQTELFVCIDSDDYLAGPKAVGDTLAFWEENKDTVCRSDISGLVSYRRMTRGRQAPFPDGLNTATLTELYAQGFQGETTIVFKTDVLRRFPFPVEEGEKFITEAIVYDLMDERYRLLLHRYYMQVCEYQADGYTMNGMDTLLRNPRGYRSYYNQRVRLRKDSRRYNTQMFIALSLLIGDGKTMTLAADKWLTALCLPLGWYQYWKLKRGKW